jgi:hypothetical protein
MSDQPSAETSTWRHSTLITNRQTSMSQRNSNPQSRLASGHWPSWTWTKRSNPISVRFSSIHYHSVCASCPNTFHAYSPPRVVQFSWNVMAHGDAREGRRRENWRMEWVASTLHTTSERGVSNITTADAHTSVVISLLNWRPADLNGLVLFAERRNLVSARVPSYCKHNLQVPPLPSYLV